MTDLVVRMTTGRLPADTADLSLSVQRGRDALEQQTELAGRRRVTLQVPVVFDGDWRGPYVHGTRAERFLYLVWTRQDTNGRQDRVGRSKVILGPEAVAAAEGAGDGGRLTVTLDLADSRVRPRTARLAGDNATWSRT